MHKYTCIYTRFLHIPFFTEEGERNLKQRMRERKQVKLDDEAISINKFPEFSLCFFDSITVVCYA